MRLILALALALVPTAVFAHPGHGETVGILHGFEHQLGSPESLLALGFLALLLAGGAALLVQRARKARRARRP